MHTNSFSKFGDDFPIAGLSVKQFIELCVSLGFGNRPNSYPNKPESPPPEIMGINDVIKLTGYSKATIYKFTHQRLIPFHRPAHGGRRLVFIRQEIEDWMKENSIPTFGKIVQMRESHSVSNENITTSTNTQLETLIPASKISNLTQGMFVGAVADNFDEPIPQKIFHAEIVIDNEKVKAETVAYVPIPDISSFIGEDGIDHMEEIVRENYYRVKSEIAEIIDKEIRRIEADPNLVQLLPKKK